MAHIQGFPPISAADARVLILGSMPGKPSLSVQQYYAHPRNAFWKIMGDLFGVDPAASYEKRNAELIENRIAVWDVLQLCTRESSLDSDIDDSSIVPNHLERFLSEHPAIRLIGLNGAKAAKLFERHVVPTLSPENASIPRVRLPSTSPANAAASYDEKLRAWRDAFHGAGIA